MLRIENDVSQHVKASLMNEERSSFLLPKNLQHLSTSQNNIQEKEVLSFEQISLLKILKGKEVDVVPAPL